jgi:hypothetical protein
VEIFDGNFPGIDGNFVVGFVGTPRISNGLNLLW